MRQIHEALSSLSVDPKVIGQAKVDLDLMLSEFGANPMLERLSSRLQSVIPGLSLRSKSRSAHSRPNLNAPTPW